MSKKQQNQTGNPILDAMLAIKPVVAEGFVDTAAMAAIPSAVVTHRWFTAWTGKDILATHLSKALGRADCIPERLEFTVAKIFSDHPELDENGNKVFNLYDAVSATTYGYLVEEGENGEIVKITQDEDGNPLEPRALHTLRITSGVDFNRPSHQRVSSVDLLYFNPQGNMPMVAEVKTNADGKNYTDWQIDETAIPGLLEAIKNTLKIQGPNNPVLQEIINLIPVQARSQNLGASTKEDTNDKSISVKGATAPATGEDTLKED